MCNAMTSKPSFTRPVRQMSCESVALWLSSDYTRPSASSRL